MPKYVLFYESADDVRSTAPLYFPAHVARWNGVVRRWSIREWNEAIANP